MNLLILMIALSNLHATHGLTSGVPVLIIEEKPLDTDHLHSFNPLKTIQPSTFSDIIAKAVRKSKVIIIFVEESLSVEDFSLRDKDGSPFSFLQGMIRSKKATYYPSVEEPYASLTEKLKPDIDSTYTVTDDSAKIQIYRNDLKYYYVVFKETEYEKRATLLRRHDKVIFDVYEGARKLTDGVVTCFYTSASPPVKRLVLVPLGPKDPGVYVADPAGIFYLKKVVQVKGGIKSTLTDVPTASNTGWTDKGVAIKLKFADAAEVDLNYTFWKAGWSLDYITLYVDGKISATARVGAIASWGRSYACADPIYVSGAGLSLSIGEYQIQPYLPAPTRRRRQTVRQLDESSQQQRFLDVLLHDHSPASPLEHGKRYKRNDKAFDTADMCTVMFTVPILMGLLVVLLMSIITSLGITMMMDLKTPDRFDDPHGKALVVNTDE